MSICAVRGRPDATSDPGGDPVTATGDQWRLYLPVGAARDANIYDEKWTVWKRAPDALNAIRYESVQLNAQVNDSLLFASRYLVPRRVSRECVCVCEGNLVWLSLCQTANRGISLKSTLGCSLRTAHAKRDMGGVYSLRVYSQGQQAHPPSPPEQILNETSLPANLIHKHSRANKENV